MNLRTSKAALLLGLINGILFYLAYQPVKIAYVKYLWYIKNDNYVYISLPEIYRIARDAGEVFVWMLLFMVASYTAHRLWAANLKSIVSLWLRVAVISIAVPVIGLWFVHFLLFFLNLVLIPFDACFTMIPCHSSMVNMMLYFVRESIDIKFEILLLTSALIGNFFYGATLTKLSKHFAK